MNRKKILIVTSRDDSHADHIISKLNDSKRGDDIIRLNTEDFVHNCAVSFNGLSVEVDILDSARSFNSSDIKSVWYRRPKEFEILSNDSESVKSFIHQQSNAFLRGFYFCCHDDARWINPLPALHRSRIKMQQLQLASKLGLAVPDTLITNEPAKALAFFRKLGKVCTKSLDEPNFTFDGHIFPMLTRVINEEKEFLENLESINRCPVLFQQYIEKTLDVRVVVFGQKVFAFEIHSQEQQLSKWDVRGISPHLLDHEPHQLPPDIESLILSFMSRQGLVFSSLDFVLTEDRKYWFLENNPNGQWLWLESLTGMDLTSHMIDLLQE
jgi:glutathione synthase/RimK-type ligase-like ATP-grasp enzyme